MIASCFKLKCNGLNPLYARLTNEAIECNIDQQSVYSVNKGSLPRNMRTVLLKSPHNEVPNLCYVEVNCSSVKHCKKLSLLSCIAGLIVVILLSTSVTLIIRNIGRDSVETAINETLTKNNSQPLFKTDDANVFTTQNYKNDVYNRNRCRRICWKYAAFKFRSRCEAGQCICHGKGYNPVSCLPDTAGCSITHTENKNIMVTSHGRQQSVYKCKQSTRETLFVFSVYQENNEAENTTVRIRRASSRQYHGKHTILVLCSYSRRQWLLDTDVPVHDIYLVSTTHIGLSSVNITYRDNEIVPVAIMHRRSNIGYGQDSNNSGHTVELLQSIQQQIGNVTAFIGSKSAQNIDFNLDYL